MAEPASHENCSDPIPGWSTRRLSHARNMTDVATVRRFSPGLSAISPQHPPHQRSILGCHVVERGCNVFFGRLSLSVDLVPSLMTSLPQVTFHGRRSPSDSHFDISLPCSACVLHWGAGGSGFESRARHGRGRGGLVVRLLPSHRGESCRTMPLVCGFSRGSPVPSKLAFRRFSVLTSFHAHRLSRRGCLEPPKSLASPPDLLHVSSFSRKYSLQPRRHCTIPQLLISRMSTKWNVAYVEVTLRRGVPAPTRSRRGFLSGLFADLAWTEGAGRVLASSRRLPRLPPRHDTRNCTSIRLKLYVTVPMFVMAAHDKWESCRTMPLVGGFSRGSPVSPAPSFRRCSIFTSITIIGSEDPAVKSRPNLFTPSLLHKAEEYITCHRYTQDDENSTRHFSALRLVAMAHSMCVALYRLSTILLPGLPLMETAMHASMGRVKVLYTNHALELWRQLWKSGSLACFPPKKQRARPCPATITMPLALWCSFVLSSETIPRRAYKQAATIEIFKVPPQFSQCPASSQCSIVLRALTHTQWASLTGFHALSFIHTKNTSSAVVPHLTSRPHTARWPSPKTAGR
ncbi:hypothetical protein PR048_031802 [Dryococelus australis]|uniref:Uncharacterized protein n=1 Tax=Dryococelus australis TaxID=614101 RepID=A0ABQ9G6X1_9NEOP|nr:hypothetical protein PR048_031802 [Dryococelus australis]